MVKNRNRPSLAAFCGAWLVLVLLHVPAAPAGAAQAGDFYYRASATQVVITDYFGPGGEVTIPEAIGGKPVTGIGFSVFAGQASLVRITIPSGVTNISTGQYGAFTDCARLAAIVVDPLNAAYTSWDGVLFDKSLTTLLQYPGGKAGNYAIPGGVTTIAENAFTGSAALADITIPASVTNLEYHAFTSCPSLAAIHVATQNPAYASRDGVLFNQSLTKLIQFPGGRAGNYVIPGGVASLEWSAFQGCARLTGITLPASLATIEWLAFQDCTGLTNVTLAGAVSSIGGWAFSGCTSLAGIRLPASLVTIEQSAFSGCTALAEIVLPAGVASLGYDAFNGCTSLPEVTLPASVTAIVYSAFTGCSSLAAIHVDPLNPAFASRDGVLFDKTLATLIQYPAGKAGSFVLPGTVATIVDNAFTACAHLEAITVDPLNSNFADWDGVLFDQSRTTLIQFPGGKAGDYAIPDGVAAIGWAAFQGCAGLRRVTLPGSLTDIGGSAFLGCAALTNALLPESVATIGGWAFSGCTSLPAAAIPGGVVDLAEATFAGCTSLAQVTIPNSVTNLGYGAFQGCTRLSNVTIPASVVFIDQAALAGCTSLAAVYFEGAAPAVGGKVLTGSASQATIFYPADAAGWGTNFEGHPTAPWQRPLSYQEWAKATGLLDKYPNASGESDDPDRDGMTNRAEMAAGTDPTNPHSVLAFERVPRPNDLEDADKTPAGAGQLAIYFQSFPGKTYALQSLDRLGGNWQDVLSLVATTTQKRALVPKPVKQVFYRVVLTGQ